MQVIKLSESTAAYRRVYFLAVDPTDLKTRKTGLGSFTVKRSKNGAAGAAGGGTVTEVDAANLPGVYYYEASTGDVDTLGLLALDITQATMETRELVVMVGLNNLFDAYNVNVSTWLTSTPDALSSGKVPADVKLWLTAAPNALVSGRPDVSIGAVASAAIAAGSFAAGALGAVWDELTANHTTAATLGKALGTNLDATISGIPAAVLATALEGSKTVAQVLRGIFRMGTAKRSGYSTNTVKIRDAADTKDSMTVTTTADGFTVAYNDLT